MPRDDFSQETKDLLAKRVGFRCSNPNCRQLTSGPHEVSTKATNIGVASHITAASPGGKRYDPNLSFEERTSPENGIWLCQNHGKLVDDDDIKYTVELLKDWKKTSEHAALLEVEGSLSSKTIKQDDTELIRFYSQCFDRPAFQDRFYREGSMEAFDKAIEDTITAINTGCLRARDGGTLSQSKGKSFLENAKWRNTMDVVVDLLRALRSRYKEAVEKGEIRLGRETNRKQFYDIQDRDLAEWMDKTRVQIVTTFNAICEEAQIPSLRLPYDY